MSTPTMHDLFGPVISAYTRADALADGTLTDVSALAKEAGVNWPVAMTRAAHTEFVAWDGDDALQDETGRTWDVVSMLRFALGSRSGGIQPGARVPFQVAHVTAADPEGEPVTGTLHAVFSVEDGPCWTLMLPHED